MDIVIVVIYVLILVYVFIRYNLEEYKVEEIPYDREEPKLDASEMAYLLDRKTDASNLILADILTLVKEEYLILEKTQNDYILHKNIEKDISKIKKHEMLSLNFVWNYEKVPSKSLKELSELLENGDYDEELMVKDVTIRNLLYEELEEQDIINVYAKNKLNQFNKIAKKLLIISIFAVILLLLFKSTYLFTGIATMIFAILLKEITDPEQEKYTRKRCSFN